MALPDYNGYLYLVRLYSKDGKEQFHKIGVAARGAKARFAYGNQRIIDSNLPTLEKLRRVLINKEEYISETPYEVETIYEVQFKYIGDAYLAERDLLGALEDVSYKPSQKFSGASECFKGDDDRLKLVREFMDTSAASANEKAPNPLRYALHQLKVRDQSPIDRHLKIMESIKADQDKESKSES